MFLSDASIRRPIAMGCLIIALTILGFNASRKIGLDLMPRADLPYITITTIYPGASPSEIETDIAKPIEDQMVSLDGLKHVSSTCMENVTQTMLEFNLDVDVDIAATDVREKLDLIRADFPEDAEDPKILKYDINAKPVIQMALTGDLPIDEIYDYADNTLRDRLTVLSGVADVTLVGGAEREVHVILERGKLAARGLTSFDVIQAIQQGIRTIPSGRIRDRGMEYSVKFDADYARVEDINTLEIANMEGQRCYIKDVGHVEMSTEELRQIAIVDGRPCVSIKVVKKSDANAVKVVNSVKNSLDVIKKNLPGGMELVWVTDDGTFIEATVSSAWTNVGQGIILTALILFLFLYNFRTLLVVSITMPLTIVIGLFFIYFMGFTFNIPTLLAIGMSVGILVTNSIVVLEGISRRLDETGDPKSSSRLGAKETSIAVLASAGTNVVVLFPLSMMASRIGIFIRSFSLSMVVMTIVSLFISFTLTPLLCSILLKPKNMESDSILSRMEKGWNRWFDRIVSVYGSSLDFLEKKRLAGLLVLLTVGIILLHSFFVASRLGSGFFSEADRGDMLVKMEFPTWYNLGRTSERVNESMELIKSIPHLRHVLITIGKVEGMMGQASEGVNLAQVLLKFTDKTGRDLSIHDLLKEVRKRLMDIPDAIMTASIPNISGGQSSGIELEIAGDDLKVLDRLALKAKDFTTRIDGIIDQDTSVRIGKPEIRIRPNRDVMADLGSPVTGLGIVIRANLEGIEAGTYKRNARNYDIVVIMEEIEGRDQIENTLLPGKGAPVLLKNLAYVEETTAPVQIIRKDKLRISKLFTNLDEKLPLGTAVNLTTKALNEKGVLPPGYSLSFSGMYEIMAEGQSGIAEAALISLVLVFLALAAIMESFKQPVIILVTVPLALIGMFYGLYLAGKSIEMFALMGGVMLIGIVVNNAILIMDRLNILVEEGVPRHRAMIRAACERFRPVAMITLAAVLGMLPLAIGRGIGSEMRHACGAASVGGILVSGILTMYVLPVLYNLCTHRRLEK
ncbi:MAG: efflux RND transporter permease subunit [Deltaproteobacteria bacterium]|nr:efflux RND transporter permease subunit [Deltaproteobacteria bacterium]